MPCIMNNCNLISNTHLFIITPLEINNFKLHKESANIIMHHKCTLWLPL